MRKFDIDFNLFSPIKDAEIAYFLGLLWADGTVRGAKNRTKIYAKEEDLLSIKHVFDFIGTWSIWKNDDRKNKTRLEFSTSNSNLYNFLINNDYYDKSIKSPDKIISKIPKEIQSFFYHGMLDGDGCICVPRSGSIKISFAGSVGQCWNSLECLCKNLDIRYRIQRTRTKIGGSSYFNITRGYDMVIFGDFIYKNHCMGFPRKFEKYKQLLHLVKGRIKRHKRYYYDNFYKCYKCSSSKISGKNFKTEKEILLFLERYDSNHPCKRLLAAKIIDKFI